MNELINSDEVFALAIQIEANAADYYRRAAELQTDPMTAEFLEELAVMEDGHERAFVRMRAAAAESHHRTSSQDLILEGGLFLSAIVAGYRIEGSAEAADNLTGIESLAEILKTALELEKQSVLFYLGLLEVVATNTQRIVTQAILNEEKNHVAILTEKLSELECHGIPFLQHRSSNDVEEDSYENLSVG